MSFIFGGFFLIGASIIALIILFKIFWGDFAERGFLIGMGVSILALFAGIYGVVDGFKSVAEDNATINGRIYVKEASYKSYIDEVKSYNDESKTVDGVTYKCIFYQLYRYSYDEYGKTVAIPEDELYVYLPVMDTLNSDSKFLFKYVDNIEEDTIWSISEGYLINKDVSKNTIKCTITYQEGSQKWFNSLFSEALSRLIDSDYLKCYELTESGKKEVEAPSHSLLEFGLFPNYNS